MPTWIELKRAYSCQRWTGHQHHRLEQLRREAYWSCVLNVVLLLMSSKAIQVQRAQERATKSAVKLRRRRGWRHDTAQVSTKNKRPKANRQVMGSQPARRNLESNPTQSIFPHHTHRSNPTPALPPNLTSPHITSLDCTSFHLDLTYS